MGREIRRTGNTEEYVNTKPAPREPGTPTVFRHLCGCALLHILSFHAQKGWSM